MTTNGPAGDHRLDSWKAIADYLGRDIGTVRRWERLQGLPVRRVPGGRGSSVFAYTTEIDAWLKGPQSEAPVASQPAPQPIPVRWSGWVIAPLVLIAMLALAFRGTSAPRADVAGLRAEVSKQSLTAFDAAGGELWRHAWDERYEVVFSEFSPGVQVSGDAEPVVYSSTSYRERIGDRRIESGELVAFGSDGRRQWSFAFDDTVTFGGKPFTAPWAITTFAREDLPKTSRLAVAAHHYVWGPSLVAVLDSAGRRLGTFAHSGWVEALRWMNAETLLVAGFSESQNGGMVALLDTAKLDAQGPEAAGTEHYCDSCGKQLPRRMMVMPRSELNRVTNSRFNRAAVSIVGDRIVVHTLEVPSTTLASDAIYEFTTSLDPIRATYSQQYWATHDALHTEGKLDHPRERCPDRNGPRAIRSWSPSAGWSTVSPGEARP
ncbi:MAG: hypothetical protein Q8T13_19520 [Acidobacteriota bacterium]|nr:hypothetical protein [Acidobacteriota bacterium]